jgi:purine-binding chemotaxis protein CheW
MDLLVFTVADEGYALNISGVREVIRVGEIIPVPAVSDFVEGVINFRGKVLPIINFRRKFGFPDGKKASSNRIIITETKRHLLGILVDKVEDVISLDQAKLTLPDAILREAEYLEGVGKTGDKLVLVVDIEKLFSNEDENGIAKVHEKVEIRQEREDETE